MNTLNISVKDSQSVKEQILSELYGLLFQVKECLIEVREIKQKLERKKPNYHPSNMKLSKPTWERAFIKEYGGQLLNHLNENAWRWVSNGFIPTESLRGYYTNGGRKGLTIKKVKEAHEYYLKYQGYNIQAVRIEVM